MASCAVDSDRLIERRGDRLEGARDHDQLGHLHDRIDVGRARRSPAARRLVKSSTGVAGPVGDARRNSRSASAWPSASMLKRPMAPSCAVVLRDHAVAARCCGGPALGSSVIGAPPTSSIGIAVERLQLAGLESCACGRRAYRRCPAGVWMASQASPCTATSSGLSVAHDVAGARARCRCRRARRRRPDRRRRCDSSVSNFTSSARKPAVATLATLLAIVSSRRSQRDLSGKRDIEVGLHRLRCLRASGSAGWRAGRRRCRPRRGCAISIGPATPARSSVLELPQAGEAGEEAFELLRDPSGPRRRACSSIIAACLSMSMRRGRRRECRAPSAPPSAGPDRPRMLVGARRCSAALRSK